ncbi:hypothetical protein BJ742DRAFT_782331 [Cladochytrium replicatum]|nr:hypothetical protein BJ742DRAFT_782331 [Cladochytrium replicatum]
MFTGIVETMGTVAVVERMDTTASGGGGFAVTIEEAGPVLVDVALGDSIACDGVCLTVTEFNESRTSFKVGISPETLRKTNIGEWKAGHKVNLERAMSAETRFGGHFVQGHVDTIVTLAKKQPDPPNSLLLTLRVPRPHADTDNTDFLNYIVAKGYVCLNGTSLTVVSVDTTARTFNVMLIAYTQSMVNIPLVEEGQTINLEVDQIGKYVENVARSMLVSSASGAASSGFGQALEGLVEKVVRKVLAEKQ